MHTVTRLSDGWAVHMDGKLAGTIDKVGRRQYQPFCPGFPSIGLDYSSTLEEATERIVTAYGQ